MIAVCPTCKTEYDVDASDSGSEAECLNCGKSFVVNMEGNDNRIKSQTDDSNEEEPFLLTDKASPASSQNLSPEDTEPQSQSAFWISVIKRTLILLFIIYIAMKVIYLLNQN